MDKSRITRWLDEWIEISHEIIGLKSGDTKCEIVLPCDIVDLLTKSDIIKVESDGYKYKGVKVICVTYLYPEWSNEFKITIKKHE